MNPDLSTSSKAPATLTHFSILLLQLAPNLIYLLTVWNAIIESVLLKELLSLLNCILAFHLTGP